MTECERLVEEGIIRPDFYQQEVRCDFEVTTERKKIWAIGIDLLLQLDKVCRQNGLKYFLIDGSLLGAIRHKGFIPWDDDIDVGMLREDYDRLMELKHLFSGRYYLQEPGKDIDYYYSFAKLRNSNTTCICKHFAYQKFNQGCFLDIFPFDSVTDNLGHLVYPKIRFLNTENSTYMRKSNPCLSIRDRERVASHSGISPEEALVQIDEMARSCDSKSAQHYACVVSTVYTLERKLFPKHAFNSFMSVPFEGVCHVPIPVGYDEILKIEYGNYMQFPPVSQRGDWHTYYDYNTDVPYVDSYNQVRAN